jgi:hypothetical protein
MGESVARSSSKGSFAPGQELAGKDSQSHEGALFDGSEVDHSESKIGDE